MAIGLGFPWGGGTKSGLIEVAGPPLILYKSRLDFLSFANATAKIKRSEFNAGKYSPYVGHDVMLTIALEAVKE